MINSNQIKNEIEIVIELLDEGTDTWRPTKALDIGDNLFKVLPIEGYDPEDEIWAFPPGEIVRLEKKKFGNGKEHLVAKHKNPDAVRISVRSANSELIHTTNAISLGDGLYKVLATPNYDPEIDSWAFPPDSTVALEEKNMPGGNFLLAVSPDT